MTRSAIFYSYHVSHVLNLGQIPAMMQASGWKVRCFNAFPAESYPLPRTSGIKYRFDAPLQILDGQEADLYLTPLVGQTSCFPKRALRIHFLVSLTSLEGVYDESMFDHYDAIVCAGRHHIDEFVALGRKRSWKGKTLLPVGYPKLDGQRRLFETSDLASDGAPITVVFAPTHAYYVNSQFSVLGRYGERIVESLIGGGIKVIFRPQIESWKDQDKRVVEHIVDRFGHHSLFVLDRSGNYFETYAKSHLMLTDISGTGFTYAFPFGKPALFFAPDELSEAGKKGIQFERRENIGLVVRHMDDLVGRVHLSMRHMPFLKSQIISFRDWLIFNPGDSEHYFSSNIKNLLSGRCPADWVKI